MERIDSREKLKEYLDCEWTLYNCGLLRFCPLLITERQILHRHSVLLRKTEYHTNTRHKLRAAWYKLRLLRLQNRYCLHVFPNTCGKGLSIAHVGPIIIHGSSQIGDHLRINVGVNIGANGGKPPVLGDHVYIGPGAKLFGEITIADGCRIGANAVVNKSCTEPNTTLVGVPAHPVCRAEENE